MNTTTHIPTRLKELRTKNNYSQTYVAEYLNISRQAISRWENGNATPDLDNLILLAKLYNTSVDDLLGIQNENILSEETVTSTKNTLASSFEILGLSIILVLSMLFPFAPIAISALIALWMKMNKRNYPFVYVLCAICLIVGTYNTYTFFMHIIPNNGVATITPV